MGRPFARGAAAGPGGRQRPGPGPRALRRLPPQCTGRGGGRLHMAVTHSTPSLTALDVVRDAPVIPVIVLHDERHAVPLAQALVAGGLRMLEVTLRPPQALACMRAIAAEVPQAVVGAGTVRSPADAEAAARAGARFAVSPGFTPTLARACRGLGLPLLPGVATASEILAAQEEGCRAL